MPIRRVCVFPRWSGRGHSHRDHSTPLLFLFSSLLLSSFEFNLLSNMATEAPFPTWSVLFLFTSDLHRHFGATSAVLFMETEPRDTSYLQGVTLVFHQVMSLTFDVHIDCHHGATTDRRPAEFVKFYNNLEENSPYFQVRRNFFSNQYQLRLNGTTSTSI